MPALKFVDEPHPTLDLLPQPELKDNKVNLSTTNRNLLHYLFIMYRPV